MTVLSITAANVVAGTGAKVKAGIAGATITAGMAVYQDASTRKYLAADADSATAAVRTVAGIALNGASDGQPLDIQTEGEIDLGATLTVGTIYVLDTSAGGIAPSTDLASGEYVSLIGVAVAADNLKLGILNSGVAVPGG